MTWAEAFRSAWRTIGPTVRPVHLLAGDLDHGFLMTTACGQSTQPRHIACTTLPEHVTCRACRETLAPDLHQS